MQPYPEARLSTQKLLLNYPKTLVLWQEQPKQRSDGCTDLRQRRDHRSVKALRNYAAKLEGQYAERFDTAA
ncbi:hypothetical protein A9995_06785 [Erythrobacter sp. QSSC1-22B]|uniref:hypothetical protein n=1 Tax=Erythrobacter sp. QSSC1-22B TaxID=1860125 RepID=UPI0008048880|nr:hypothetical protein [Erythrobacter sp. QSSC1-22B]OBX19456.1 hypothetical protein A9995_06785 [Erythrobacter sp. QSSC1-22B]